MNYTIKTATHEMKCFLCQERIRPGESYLLDDDGDKYCTEEMAALNEHFELQDTIARQRAEELKLRTK